MKSEYLSQSIEVVVAEPVVSGHGPRWRTPQGWRYRRVTNTRGLIPRRTRSRLRRAPFAAAAQRIRVNATEHLVIPID
jgi:hypothetical protein